MRLRGKEWNVVLSFLRCSYAWSALFFEVGLTTGILDAGKLFPIIKWGVSYVGTILLHGAEQTPRL